MVGMGDVVIDLPAGGKSSLYEEYKAFVLPWGETCRAAEKRLADCGKRIEWDAAARRMRKEHPEMDYHECMKLTHLEFSPEKLAERGDDMPVTATLEEYLARCREGLRLNLPERVGIEKELDWIGSNFYMPLPNVYRAPSLFSLNWLIACKSEQDTARKFWDTVLAKRMSPGDSKSKKGSAVKEDSGDVEAEASDEELRRRLFGSDE